MKKVKNRNSQNFTKLTQRGGISLIVLVITIIVIIILAAAVIITINNNNPIAEANRARYESDRANMQAIFTNAIAKVMTHNRGAVSVTAGQVNTTTSGVKEATGEVAYTVTNAMNSNNASGKVIFDKGENTDTQFYTGKQLPIYAAGETKWYVDSEGTISLEVAGVKYGDGAVTSGSEDTSTTVSASTVASDPTTYYGEKVTNYSTGDSTIDSQVEWQIFYADTSNIYLIATDYVANANLPKAKVTAEDGTETEYALNTDGEYKAYFTDIVINSDAYKGSEDITNMKLQTLNKSYHDYLTTNNTTSTEDNMKAVAYMMDIDIWDTFAGEKAEYAIGGTTIEMLMKSYSQKYSEDGADYGVQASSATGYQISNDGGVSWANWYNGMLDTTDTQYVISDKTKASAMWLASPSAGGGSDIMGVTYNGSVGGNSYYSDFYLGFRPLVCLNSSVSLKAVTGGFEIE